jgi:predicted GNAT superfamily acetyltransferase
MIVKEVSLKEAFNVHTTVSEFKDSYNLNFFKDKITCKNSLILVAYLDNTPVGYLVGYNKFKDNSFYCWMAGVNPNFRRKGALSALMNHQEKWAQKKGYKKIKIKTRNSRKAILSYLIKSGFNIYNFILKDLIENNEILLEKEI